MSLFLHISDLHLKKIDRPTDDYKTDIGSSWDRTNSGQALRDTLAALGEKLRTENRLLDALFITGDITERNKEDGFQQLENTLSVLQGSRPPVDQTIVVPGNHDVAWRQPPGSAERYAHFMKYVRAAGYITPLLDGIDYKEDTIFAGDWRKHYFLTANRDCLIIPMNSSNYCGSLQGLHKESGEEFDEIKRRVVAMADDCDEQKLLRIIEKLREFDIPRISPQQFRVLKELIDHISVEYPEANNAERIVLIHHQLLPVSDREELKPFESITNLGRLRSFLREYRFRLVLHGHKHEGALYQDSLHDLDAGTHHSLWVVAGASGDITQGTSAEACRLIEVTGSHNAGAMTLTRIPASRPGGSIPLESLPSNRVLLWTADDLPEPRSGIHSFIAQDADGAYQRLMTYFSGYSPSTVISNLTCHIYKGPTGLKIPLSYPKMPHISTERQKWFEDLIAWWQRPETKLHERETFNHGVRIFGTIPESPSQFERVVAALVKDAVSSRAVVAVFNPYDDRPETDRDFPSFCMLQFVIRHTQTAGPFLDCIAFFRKQEMRYWWPVNIGELASLQRTLVERLSSEVKLRNISAGSLTTVASLAHVGTVPPRVAIPTIDQAVDNDPQALFDLAYCLFHPIPSATQNAERRWSSFLDELIPALESLPEGFPIAIDGLIVLITHLKLFGQHHHSVPVPDLIRHLQSLVDRNKRLLNELRPATSQQYRDWASSVAGHLKDIKSTVSVIVAGMHSE